MQPARSTTVDSSVSTSRTKLRQLDASLITRTAEWLSEKDNYQWLEFGFGNQLLTAETIKLMTQRDGHLLRVFTDETGEIPIGIIALNNISRGFKTAALWYVLGDKRFTGQGCTRRAVSRMLHLGFEELDLNAITSWAVEANRASIRILRSNGFQLIGRQRRCHYIDGLPHDRLLFDVLRSEFKGIMP